jgi:Leucine-rich repeat (LRR) protein
LFEDIAHVELRAHGGVSIRSMHSQGFEVIKFHWMQIFEDNPGRVGGGLTCLKILRMWECEALREFPSGVCTLKALEELDFSGCKSLKTIPEGLGGLTYLKILRMWDCEALELFPSRVCTRKALEELDFSGCKSLRTIPEGLGGLTCLKKLYMWDYGALEESHPEYAL